MKLLQEDLQYTTPMICEIQKEYVRYIHRADWRVSVKYNNRKFVGLAVRINDRLYVVPLTSQTTTERIARGKKKRIQIDPLVDTYLANEERQIRKKWVEINEKSVNVYRERYNEGSRNYRFLEWTCCDFKKLEEECDNWEKEHMEE